MEYTSRLLTVIRWLPVDRYKVEEAGLVAGLTNLEELDLYGVKVTDAGLESLRNLTALRKLNLLGADIGDESAAVLAGLTHLRELNLYRSRMTNSGLAKIAALKELVSLDVRYSRITGSGVDGFRAAIPHCKVDFVSSVASSSGPQVHPQGTGDDAIAKWVREAGGKVEVANGKITSISLEGRHFRDTDLAGLAGLSSLRSLNLSATEVSDTGLAALKNLVGLQTLLLNNTTISDTGLRQLAGLRGLRRLGLEGTLVHGEGFEGFKAPALVELDLTSAPVNDEGVKRIAAFGSLERLLLSYSDISDVSISELARLTRLKVLNLDGTDIGDTGMLALGNSPGLRNWTSMPAASATRVSKVSGLSPA